jgi:hypothetical protein
MPERRLPSPAGVLVSGFDYQHLYTLIWVFQLIWPDAKVVKVGFEVDDAGNVDDLVIGSVSEPPQFIQVKFVVDQREVLTGDWFMTPPKPGAKTPLERFYASYEELMATHGRVAPNLALQTNRQRVAGDPILDHLGGHDDKLMPRLAQPRVKAATKQARAAWAEHLDISEEQLFDFLDHLQIQAGRDSLEELFKHCSLVMRGAGLKCDEAAVFAAQGRLRRMIGEGVRWIDADGVRTMVKELDLEDGNPEAALLVQAIEHDLWPESATAAVDWVHLFIGDEARERRQLRDPTSWNSRLLPELEAAVSEIRRTGITDVAIRGAMRVSTGLVAGELLSRVRGFRITATSALGEWTSDAPAEKTNVSIESVGLERGADLAMGLSVSQDVQSSVLRFLESTQLPISRFLNVQPPSGADISTISSVEAGTSMARALSQALRDATDDLDEGAKLHLFMATPLPVAILVGYLWNRMPPTQLYDDLGRAGAYAPTFLL